MNYLPAIYCMSMHAGQDLMLALTSAGHVSCLQLHFRGCTAQSYEDSFKLRQALYIIFAARPSATYCP